MIPETPDTRTIGETNIDEIIDITITKKNVIMDATILTSLMACPRLTDFRFNLSLQSIGGKSNSLECGSILHKFLEVYYGSQIQGLDKNKAFGFGIIAAELYIQGCPHCTDFIPTDENPKPSCGHRINDYPGVFNTPADNESKPYQRTGWRFVLQTCDEYHKFYANDHWVPLLVETVKGKVLYEDDEVRILWKAKLDSLFDTNQGVFPVDHKSMKQRRDTVSLNNQFIGQCLVTEVQRMFINKVGFQTSLKPEEKFLRAPISYSAPRLIEWQSEILPYYAKLLLMYAESGYFPPNYSACEGKYGNCAFMGVCSSEPGMREEELKNNFKVGPQWNPTNEDE